MFGHSTVSNISIIVIVSETSSIRRCLDRHVFALLLFYNCNVPDSTCFIADFFEDECSKDAAKECGEFRPEVPMSKKFDSDSFKEYCR